MRERGKRGASRRIVSVLLAVLLLVTSIPMDGVYAAEANTVQSQIPEETGTANIGEATNDATSDKTNENTTIDGVETPVDETSEEGGESYKVLSDKVSEYVSVKVYKDVDGNELTAEDTLENGAKVYVNVTEDKGYAHNVPSCQEDDDFAEVMVGEEAIGCYVFTIEEADLDLNSLIEVVEGDGGSNADEVVNPKAGEVTITVDTSTYANSTEVGVSELKLTYTDGGEEKEVPALGVTPNTGVTVSVKVSSKLDNKYIKEVKLKDTATNDGTDVTLEYSDTDGVWKTDTQINVIAAKSYTLEVTTGAIYTISAKADNTDDVKFGKFNDVKVKENANTTVSISITAELTKSGEKAGKEIESLKFSYGNDQTVTLNRSSDTNKFTGTISAVSGDISGTITANLKTIAKVTLADELDLSYALTATPVLYKATLDASGKVTRWDLVSSNENVYVDDVLAVALEEDYAALTAVKFGETDIFNDDIKVTVDSSNSKLGYQFTAVAKSKLEVSATLDTEIITFAKGNYTVKIGDETVDVSKNEYVYVETGSANSLTATIKPLDGGHYQLTKVDGTEVGTSDVSKKTLTITYSDLTDKKKTVSVETKQVNNLTVKTTDDGTASIYMVEGTNLGDLNDSTEVIDASTDVTLYLKLAENQGKTGTDYKFYLVNVTTGEGENAVTKNMVADLEIEDNKAPGKALLYSLNLGKLTDHTTVSVKTVKLSGSTIQFEGENYTATIGGLTLDKDLPYVGEVDDTTGVNILLTANDNYRFKANSIKLKGGTVTGLTPSVTAEGKTVNITGVTAKALKDKVLTVSAETEKTVTLKIPAAAEKYTSVAVKEAYAYHINNVVNGTGNDTDEYVVATTSKVEIDITLANPTTHKISSVTLKQTGVDEAESIDVDFKATTATVRNLTEDSTLTINVEGDKSKLQGIILVNGLYTVKYDQTNDITEGFVNEANESVESVLYLFETAISSGTTADLTLEPKTGYQLTSIKYDGKAIYDASKDSQPNVTDITVTAPSNAGGDATVKIGAALLKANAQKKLEVETKPVGLDNDYNNPIKISFGEDQYINNNEKNGIYFSPEKELQYSVEGATLDTGHYTLEKGAEYVTIQVTAPAEVATTIAFKAGNADKDGVVVEQDGNTFKIAAQALVTANVHEIVLDGTVATKDVAFTYNQNLVNVKVEGQYESEATVAAKDTNGVALTDGTVVKTYKVRQGKDLTVNATVKGGKDAVGDFRYYAKLNGAGGNDYTDYESSFVLTASDDLNVEFTTEAAVELEVLDSAKKEKLIAEDDGSYIISYGAYYYASVNKGDGKADVNKAELVVNGVSKEVEVTDNVVKFRADQSASGKTAVLNLKYVDSKNVTTDVASFNFTVAEALTKVEVEGVVSGKLAQTVDTTVRYAITLPEGSSIKDLTADSTNCEAEIDVTTQELVVTTEAAAAKEKAATIDLVNNKSAETLATITIDTVAVVGVVDATPTIKAIASTSKALKVELGAKGVPNIDLVDGCIAYKVKVTKQSGSAEPDQNIFYVPKKDDAQSATLTIFNEDVEKEGKYDVSVQLVQLNVKVGNTYVLENEDAVKVLDQSKTVTEVKGTNDFVVKVPYYTNADELVLSNQATVIYRGQKADIADVNFGEKTSYIENAKVVLKDAKGKVVNNVTVAGDVVYEGGVAFNKLYLDITSELELGTYTVVVEADAPNNTVAATASMQIKVEEGIWDLEIQNVPNTLFKAKDKAASFKATVIFNGSTKAKVKDKKVTWEIFKNVEKVDDTTYKFTPITEKDAINGMVTVKNGTVSVNKSCPVSKNESKNTFYVVATSQANPEIFDFVKVVISNEEAEMGTLLLAQEKYDDNDDFVGYEVLKDQNIVSSELVAKGDLYLIAVKKGLNKSVYTEKDLMTSSVTAKASNKKLGLYAASSKAVVYRLETSAVMKNVKITVTSMDGSKNSVQKVFTIDYVNMDNMKVAIDGKVIGDSYKFAGTSEDTLNVTLGYEDANKEFHHFEGLLNAKVSIKGGKILSSNTIDNTYIVKVTGAQATLTIQNKALKNVNYVYVLTNTAFTKTAAPAVNVDKKQIIANSVDEQKLVYSFKKAADYNFVKVQVDEADIIKLAKKNNTAYNSFMNAIGGDSVILPIKDGSFELTFKGNENGTFAIPAGGYKLFFTYGDYDASGNFIPATKAGRVTVKAVEAKKAQYTPNTAYTMSLLDTAVVELTGVAGKDTSVKYPNGSALSTIVNGKQNNFAKFFKVENGMLTLRSYEELESSDEDLVKALQKLVGAKEADDLTGYVEYRVNGNASKERVKVTVTLSKDALKSYAASKITMLAGDKVASPVSITADDKAITVKEAAVTKGSFSAVADEDGNVVMTSSSKPAVGTSEVTVKVIPSTSFYTENAKTNGVEVNVAVDAKASHSPVVTMSTTSVVFDDYDGSTSQYIGTIPYTSNIANNITKITVTDAKLESGLKNLISFEANDENAIVASLSKSDLDDAVEEQLVNYGETKNMEVTVEYCGGLVKETYTLEVKLPSAVSFADGDEDLKAIFTSIRKAVWNDPVAKYFPDEVDFEAAVVAKAEADEQYKVEVEAKDTAHTKSDKMYEEASKLYTEAAVNAVEAAVKENLVLGADIALDKVEAETYTVTNATLPGTVKVNITLKGAATVTSNTVENFTNEYVIKTYVTVPETDLMAVYTARLKAFANNLDRYVAISNSITESDIIDAARTYVNASKDYRVVAVENSWEKTQATSAKAGAFYLELKVVNVADSSKQSKAVSVEDDIAKLQSTSELATLFTSEFTKFKNGTDGYTKPNAATTAEDILAIATSLRTNNNITIAYATDKPFEFTEKELTQGTNNKKVTVRTGIKGTLVFTEEAMKSTTTASASADFDTDTNGNSWTNVSLVEKVKEALATVTFTNDSASSEKLVLRTAQNAIENAPYQVVISDWTWTQPTYKSNGRVKYVVSFRELDHASEVSDTIAMNQKIDASDNYHTFAEAVALIKDDFLKTDIKAADCTWITDKKIVPANVLTSIKKSVKDGYTDEGAVDNAEKNDRRYFEVGYVQVIDDYFTKYEDACKYSAQTVNDNGNLTVTIELTEYKDGSIVNREVITLNKLIDADTQDLDAAKAAVNALTVNSKASKSDVLKAIKKVVKYADFNYKVELDTTNSQWKVYIAEKGMNYPSIANANITIQ